MLTRTFGRVGAVALLALGLLASSAAPAGAVPATHMEILPSSAFDFRPSSTTTSVSFWHEPGHITTSPCPSVNSQPETHIPVTFDSDGTGTVAAASLPWATLTFGLNNFKRRINVLGGTIAPDPTTHRTVIALTLSVTVMTCDSLTTLCATNPFTFQARTPLSEPLADHPEVSDTSDVPGSTTHITAPFSCNSTIRTWLNSRHAVVGMGLHFTDSSG